MLPMTNIRCSTSKAKIIKLIRYNEILIINIRSLDYDTHASLRNSEGKIIICKMGYRLICDRIRHINLQNYIQIDKS